MNLNSTHQTPAAIESVTTDPDPLPHNCPGLILASASPRRKDLLEQVGLNFQIIPSGFDEKPIDPSGFSPETLVRILARAKAEDVAKQYPNHWVIGADTIVLLEGAILGKPIHRADARRMLRRLSGNIHQVYTGFAVCCFAQNRTISSFVKSDVEFKPLSEPEIEWYLDTSEPYDKAGSYAIQGLGTCLVKSVFGSYTNVVGLPVCELIDLLIREKILLRTMGSSPGFHLTEAASPDSPA
jgi:septum formation protein